MPTSLFRATAHQDVRDRIVFRAPERATWTFRSAAQPRLALRRHLLCHGKPFTGTPRRPRTDCLSRPGTSHMDLPFCCATKVDHPRHLSRHGTPFQPAYLPLTLTKGDVTCMRALACPHTHIRTTYYNTKYAHTNHTQQFTSRQRDRAAPTMSHLSRFVQSPRRSSSPAAGSSSQA